MTKKRNIKNALFIRPRDKLVPWFLCWSKLDILYIQLPFLIPYGPKRIVIKAQLSCGALDLNHESSATVMTFRCSDFVQNPSEQCFADHPHRNFGTEE